MCFNSTSPAFPTTGIHNDNNPLEIRKTRHRRRSCRTSFPARTETPSSRAGIHAGSAAAAAKCASVGRCTRRVARRPATGANVLDAVGMGRYRCDRNVHSQRSAPLRHENLSIPDARRTLSHLVPERPDRSTFLDRRKEPPRTVRIQPNEIATRQPAAFWPGSHTPHPWLLLFGIGITFSHSYFMLLRISDSRTCERNSAADSRGRLWRTISYRAC